MAGRNLTEQAALVALLQTRPKDATWPSITADVLEAGSAVEVWNRSITPTLLDPPGDPDPLGEAAANLARWHKEGLDVLTVLDEDYPSQLREIHQAPPLLFARGQLVANDRAVSVVGSRKASARGLRIAEEIARALVAEEITVMAGLALGIDTAAHEAALASGGRTVAVIGTGINRSYPAANRRLQETIAAEGLVISQFWPDAPPQRHNFLMRNATMSGYGVVTVVVEAGETSGSRAQARMAVEHGRPVILTDLVVQRNEWARKLLERPRVHVVAGVKDVVTTVQMLTDEESEVRRMLRVLRSGDA